MGTLAKLRDVRTIRHRHCAEQRFCVLHFTLTLETSCSEMRRETALGNAATERQREIMKFITENGELPARVATNGPAPDDDLKARILSTFLKLMNCGKTLTVEHAELV